MENKSKVCTVAMVLGIIGLVTAFMGGAGSILCIVSLIISIVCLAKKKQPKKRAMAGLITSIIGFVVSIIAGIVTAILVSALILGGASTLASLPTDIGTESGVNTKIRYDDDDPLEIYNGVGFRVPVDFQMVAGDDTFGEYSYGGIDYEFPGYVVDCDSDIYADNFKSNVETYSDMEAQGESCKFTYYNTSLGESASWDYGFAEGTDANDGTPLVSLWAYSQDGRKLVVLLARPGSEDNLAAAEQVLSTLVMNMGILE